MTLPSKFKYIDSVFLVEILQTKLHQGSQGSSNPLSFRTKRINLNKRPNFAKRNSMGSMGQKPHPNFAIGKWKSVSLILIPCFGNSLLNSFDAFLLWWFWHEF